ncbi:hypothetical protein NFJ02_29g68830 [Pycnococcus provasolii]
MMERASRVSEIQRNFERNEIEDGLGALQEELKAIGISRMASNREPNNWQARIETARASPDRESRLGRKIRDKAFGGRYANVCRRCSAVRSAAFPDRLAGSGSLMPHCMNHLASLGDLLSEQRSLTLRELELVGFYNPLQALRIDGIAWCKQIYKGPRCVVWHDDDRQFSLR